jgi:hypothetical protein
MRAFAVSRARAGRPPRGREASRMATFNPVTVGESRHGGLTIERARPALSLDVVRSATPTARARGHGESSGCRGDSDGRPGSPTCKRSGRERDARRFRRRACRRRGRHCGSAIRNAQSPGMTSAPPLYAELATRIPPYQCRAGRVVRLAGRRWSLTVRSSSSSRADSCSGTWSHRPASEELSSLVLARVGAQLRAGTTPTL